jgi:hypothetical protein
MDIELADTMPDGWQRWLDQIVSVPAQYTKKPLLRSDVTAAATGRAT